MEKIIQTAGRNQLGDFAPDFAHFNDGFAQYSAGISIYFFYNFLPMLSSRLKSAGGSAPALRARILLSEELPGKQYG